MKSIRIKYRKITKWKLLFFLFLWDNNWRDKQRNEQKKTKKKNTLFQFTCPFRTVSWIDQVILLILKSFWANFTMVCYYDMIIFDESEYSFCQIIVSKQYSFGYSRWCVSQKTFNCCDAPMCHPSHSNKINSKNIFSALREFCYHSLNRNVS